MRYALAVILMLLSLFCRSQGRKDTVVGFFDGNLEPVKKSEAIFVGITIRDPFSGWNCLVYDDSMRVLVRGKYRDESCRIKEGWFTYYYADGKRASGGRFENNLRTDVWKTWHPNGNLKDSVSYLNGNANGGSSSFHPNGTPAAEGNFLNGLMDGRWTFYHDNGKSSTREHYREGKLEDLECFDTLGNSRGINCAIARPPTLVGRYGGIEKYLADSLRIPDIDGEPVEGLVTALYTITRDGRLTDLRIISSAHPLLSGEVIRVLGSIKGWYPAVSHGRDIEQTVTLNIPFFVNDPRGSEKIQAMETPWGF